MEKILIIGGSGFVGKSFKEYFKKKKKIQLKSYSRSEKKNILKINKLPKANYIIYCIQNSNMKKSLSFFTHFKKLLQLNQKKTKILFFSSGSVYGPRHSNLKFREKEKPSIKKINRFIGYKKKYAREKFALEKEFKKLGNDGFQVCIIRGFTFYGKHILNYDYLISNLISAAKSKKIFKIKNLNTIRSYMHADDMCRWLIRILNISSNKCPVVNLGSDKIINLSKFINFLNKKFNSKIQIVKNASKKIDFYIPSTNFAKKYLKLKNAVNFNNAITLLIR